MPTPQPTTEKKEWRPIAASALGVTAALAGVVALVQFGAGGSGETPQSVSVKCAAGQPLRVCADEHDVSRTDLLAAYLTSSYGVDVPREHVHNYLNGESRGIMTSDFELSPDPDGVAVFGRSPASDSRHSYSFSAETPGTNDGTNEDVYRVSYRNGEGFHLEVRNGDDAGDAFIDVPSVK